jgi:fibro-slime domain-containing protein
MIRLLPLLLLLSGNALAQSHNFYFLPPPSDEWVLGTPYLVWQEAGKDMMEKLTTDSRCGWYKKTFSGTVPDGPAWVWLNGHKTEPDDKVGDKGLAEDPVEWVSGNPTPFNLAERFGENRDLFFDPEGAGSWTDAYPGKDGKCTYKFAAIIYHTNDSANKSFTLYANASNKPPRAIDGVTRGIAKPTLESGKIQFSNAQGTDWTAENFKKAFESTPGTNVQRCFDMPFTKRDDLWEFDALYLCPDGSADYVGNCGASSGGRIGGFYPPSLMQNIDEYGDYTEQYKEIEHGIAGGRRVYQGQTNVRPRSCVNMWCFDRGWYGGNCATGGRVIPNASRQPPATVGDLSWVNSSTPKEEIDDYMKTICWEPIRTAPDVPRGDFYDSGNSIPMENGNNTSGNVSGLMCFESAPATFTYEEGQEFFFRGDDDIWVFINNQLVVDIGGNHAPAPGYVKLDTIKVPEKLVPGNEYPINIFFCDRRSTGSNVRISTNMYFSQNTGLYVANGSGSESKPAELCMETGGGGSCSDLASGSSGGTAKELCGNEIRNEVEYFIENRKGDSQHILWTPPGTVGQECSLSSDGNKLICYGGVVIDLEKGSASVSKDKITNITGSWTLYARVKDKPEIERVKIGSFSTVVTVRMAWGPIVDDKGIKIPGVGDVCNYANRGSTPSEAADGKGYAVPGERFPVCFAVGEHNASGNFELNEDGAGSNFSLNTSGFKNEFLNYNANAGLKVFLDSVGNNEIPYSDINQQFKIPDNGVLVLWVTGGYEQQKGTHEYKINVNGRSADEVTLYSILPRFQWIKAPGSTERPCNYTGGQVEHGSKLDAEGCAVRVGVDKTLDFAWVGEDVKLNLRAYNEKNKKTCKTCNFNLRLTAKATAPITETNSALISYPSLKIVDGEASFAIQGRIQALLPQWATITLMGPVSDLHTATWDSLQFQKPPVPIPEHSYIYDDNGDGIGDRLVMVYSRGFRRDSLPNKLEVKWDPDTTAAVLFGLSSKTSEGKYPNTGIGTLNNIEYWSHPDSINHQIKLGRLPNGQLLTTTLEERNNTIPAAKMDSVKDTIVLRGKFSKNVLTQGEGKVTNWATFKIGSNLPTTPLTGNIDEKIPAIVVRARYAAGERCANTVADACSDRVVLEFSERVKIDPAGGASDALIKNPFAYKLMDNTKDWGILNAGDVPADKDINYGSGRSWRPSESGDSVLNLTFRRYREGENKSGTPMPGDSVKFAALKNGYVGFTANVFVDLKGNKPNENEWGRQIEGRKPFTQEKLPIGEIDPNDPDYYVKEIINTLGDNGSSGYDKVKLFSKNRPVELLPVPPDWNLDDIRREYPGTVGVLFNPDISNTVLDLCKIHYEDNGEECKIKDSDITIYPRAFYHTNLGNFVADNSKYSGDGVKCNDPIFPRIAGEPSCRASKSKLYIAWDMKDMKGRFVGTGAYVGLYDFRWEIFIPATGTTEKMDAIERKVEMHGVKRVKKKQ